MTPSVLIVKDLKLRMSCWCSPAAGGRACCWSSRRWSASSRRAELLVDAGPYLLPACSLSALQFLPQEELCVWMSPWASAPPCLGVASLCDLTPLLWLMAWLISVFFRSALGTVNCLLCRSGGFPAESMGLVQWDVEIVQYCCCPLQAAGPLWDGRWIRRSWAYHVMRWGLVTSSVKCWPWGVPGSKWASSECLLPSSGGAECLSHWVFLHFQAGKEEKMHCTSHFSNLPVADLSKEVWVKDQECKSYLKYK